MRRLINTLKVPGNDDDDDAAFCVTLDSWNVEMNLCVKMYISGEKTDVGG